MEVNEWWILVLGVFGGCEVKEEKLRIFVVDVGEFFVWKLYDMVVMVIVEEFFL